MKNKSKTNLIIDAIMLVDLALVAGIGFLIKFILVPGFKKNPRYGSNVDLEYLGLDRHQWGSIHLLLSSILLALLILHIVLHWKTIKGIYRKMIANKTVRITLATTFAVASLVFMAGPLLVKPKKVPFQPLHRNSSVQTIDKKNKNTMGQVSEPLESNKNAGRNKRNQKPLGLQAKKSNKAPEKETSNLNDIPVYGYMTINEVARRNNVSADAICRHLDVPQSFKHEQLGRLKKKYNFTMSEVKKLVVSISEK